MEWPHDLYKARQYNSPRSSYDNMFTFNTGPIHISRSGSLAQYSPPVTQNEEREMPHEGYSDAITPPTTPSSSKAVSVKVINPDKKSESKLLMLRNVDSSKLDSPCELKRMIFDQFGGEIVPSNLRFDVGYYRGNKRVCLVSVNDMEDVNKLLRSTDGHEVTLWCMGCTTKQKGKRTHATSDVDSNDSSSVNERPAKKSKKKKSRYTEKLERVDETIDTLKSKHGVVFTNIQYRVWAEAIDSGNHDSFDSPPKGSFFKSQGRKSKSTASTAGSQSTSTSTESESTPESTLSLTPQKAAQLKSTYIQQIKELHYKNWEQLLEITLLNSGIFYLNK